jgi:thioredoxin-like negative regulator of GroEL
MLTLQSGDVARAYNLIEEAARRAPANLDIQLHLGEIQLKQGRSAEARKTLDALVRSAPESAQAKAAGALINTLGSAAK